ncbi:MAG: 1-acyl-sn-glycerol-3-phosphate acyltransferase [Candidatus Omnitrophica bacterium]|nr:1-acyl-sn-glycerol-3-phosphate acyltransferase [Candidatus Omnitrophota bacterium]
MRTLLATFLYHALRGPAGLILRIVYRLTVRGLEHLPRRGGCLLACNHVSFLDPAVLVVACPRRITFLARAALFREPWLGPFMRLMGAIPVERRETDVGLRQAIRMLRRGRLIAIFPEGGRQFSGRIGAAKPGVGLLAAEARVPVVPVLLRGTFEALPPGARWLRPAKIRVAFGPPIRYPDGRLSEVAYRQLAEQVTASWHHLMQESP